MCVRRSARIHTPYSLQRKTFSCDVLVCTGEFMKFDPKLAQAGDSSLNSSLIEKKTNFDSI